MFNNPIEIYIPNISKHTGGALARGIKVYVEWRSLVLERILSRWETSKASNGAWPGPVASFLLSKLLSHLDGISSIRVTALTLPLSRWLRLSSSSTDSISEFKLSSKQWLSHLEIENNSLSIKELVAKNATSTGDTSIKQVKPNVPLLIDNPSEL